MRRLSENDGENIKEVMTSSFERKSSPLNKKILHGLMNLGTAVASMYHTPQDLEWAVCEDGKTYLLQSRPVTKVMFSRDTGYWNQIHGAEVGPLGETIGGEAFVMALCKLCNLSRDGVGKKKIHHRMFFNRSYAPSNIQARVENEILYVGSFEGVV